MNFEIRHCIPFGRSLTPLENLLYALIHCYFTYSSNGGELPNLSTPCARRITVAEAALQTWLGVLHECSVPLDWYGEKEAEGVSGALKSLNATRELAYCILFESSTDRKCGTGDLVVRADRRFCRRLLEFGRAKNVRDAGQLD